MRAAGTADGARQLSRILAYTSPERGHLFPLVPILEELRRRGHEVTLRTLSPEVSRMRALGFEAEPVAPAVEGLAVEDWKARSPIGGAKIVARHFCERAEHEAADLERAIDAEHPDAVLADILTWGALGAAEAWGGPWAAFSPPPLSLPSRDTPPFGPGLRPARTPLGALLHRPVQALLERGADRLVCPGLNELRASLGLSLLDHAYELFLKPPLLLYMTAEGFDYPRSDWPRNIAMVGPCSWDPPEELPAELRDVEAPLILVTTSSNFQNDGALVRAAFAALADEPYHLVATLPAASATELVQPSNSTLLSFAPHGPILDCSICAITHGGMGATQKALARGVPVCAVPFGRDQFEVARRVEFAGAGSRLPAWRLRPDRLRTKVHEALSRRAGAERVARALAAAGGPEAAADAFERRVLQTVDDQPTRP